MELGSVSQFLCYLTLFPLVDSQLPASIWLIRHQHWRHYLEFSSHPTIVFTDHKNLEYFTTTRNLSRRQVRWAEILGDYNFKIEYRPGKKNGAADALSRKDNPCGGDGRGDKTTSMTLLDPQVFLSALSTYTLGPEDQAITESIKQLLPTDTHFGPTLATMDKQQVSTLDKYTLADGMLFYEGLICVPDDKGLKKKILEECHDAPAAGHFGIAKTHELVTRNYHWPNLRQYIKSYIAGCDVCIRNKNDHHKPYGLLAPLPVPEQPWVSISVDFITHLPASKGFTAICVFVDRFSKMAYFVATHDEIDAEGTVDLFTKHIFSNHGLPDDIVSDRGSTFISKFTRAIMKGLGIDQKLSTSFHPQTDGQTERINSILEQYLRCYVNYQQSNWSDMLPIAQFAYNNSKHSSTNETPFHAVYGCHPRLSVSLPRSNKHTTPATDRLAKMNQVHLDMKDAILATQETHKKYYDQRTIPAPSYKIGDQVWLSTKNLKTQRPTKKLDHRRIGPFKITATIGTRAYRLELPPTMHIHPVFHTNLLTPYQPDPIEGRPPKPQPPTYVEDHYEYEVDFIVDSRIHRRRLQYLVHWKGYTSMDRTWEPLDNLDNATEAIEDFHRQHPERPRGARP
ncbi:hypothetical protein [Absidia glauca]|uniref:Integrase catalytic domain-containing protein n=1 Tax=Absidia glauca TaxID=4829 RepID=A0A163JL29_ABSGL|nr:hypothetical protein [Absidia glauca]